MSAIDLHIFPWYWFFFHFCSCGQQFNLEHQFETILSLLIITSQVLKKKQQQQTRLKGTANGIITFRIA
jgi:hypothetical protein